MRKLRVVQRSSQPWRELLHWQADLRYAAWRGSAQYAVDLAVSPASQADGAFEISDLPSASYILEVQTPCADVVAAPMS